MARGMGGVFSGALVVLIEAQWWALFGIERLRTHQFSKETFIAGVRVALLLFLEAFGAPRLRRLPCGSRIGRHGRTLYTVTVATNRKKIPI